MVNSVLVFNCGSSSLKYQLIAMPEERLLAGGEAQRIGPKTDRPAQIVHSRGEATHTVLVPMESHEAAFNEVVKLLGAEGAGAEVPDLIAHRIVHGGSSFSKPTLLSDEVLARLEEIQDLAPVHNPSATELVRICRRRYPHVPQVLVFDTAFHATIPDYARDYALPRHLREDLGIRKYGFHGTSHEYVANEAARFLDKPLNQLNAVSCHLGSGGASLCAIVGGESVDNTMGFSPLQGLIMSTRSGDLDPTVATRLLAAEWGDSKAVERILNKRSGVLGLTGTSGDIRDALSRSTGHRDGSAHDAVELYLWRLKKYLGSYLAVVEHPDAIIFTDTVGETVPAIRSGACASLRFFGVEMDEARNESAYELPCDISTPTSAVRLLVIHTNEELAIARKSYALLSEDLRRQPQ